MKRSTRAEHTAWQKYKKWQKEHIDEIREGQTITSLGEFKEIYRQAGRRIALIKQEVRFQTYGKTFTIFSRVYKAETGKALSPEARKKSTRELAAEWGKQLRKHGCWCLNFSLGVNHDPGDKRKRQKDTYKEKSRLSISQPRHAV